MNNQQVERYNTLPRIEVHSIFHTIQGEGPFSGTPAVFIRLAGCNLQCPFCDTDYTSHRMNYAPSGLLDEVNQLTKDNETKLVVITGGEPFRQNLEKLFIELVDHGYYVQVETNGTMKCPNRIYNFNFDERKGVYIVCSPKTPSLHPSIIDNVAAVKYVLSADSVSELDGLPVHVLGLNAGKVSRRLPFRVPHIPIYVQPADMDHIEPVNFENRRAAIDSCLKFGYIFQLQVHKIIGMP